MACMGGGGCSGTTPQPKPQLAASIIRKPVADIGAKIIFGKPKITRGK